MVMHKLFLEILKRIGPTIYLPETPIKIRPSLLNNDETNLYNQCQKYGLTLIFRTN
jgi:hypothetical protein